MAFVLFGLTGGLSSGKSSVATHWKKRGLPVIDADRIAREVVAPGSAALAEVARELGADLVDAEGSLDRKRVAALVFADPGARRKLEAITHPRIAAATMVRASELESAGEALACYEATLLVERGLADSFRPLVVVVAEEAAQVAWAVRRGGLSEAEARARLRAQLPAREKAAAADHVITNDRDLAWLLARADDVLDAVAAAAGVDPRRYPRSA